VRAAPESMAGILTNPTTGRNGTASALARRAGSSAQIGAYPNGGTRDPNEGTGHSPFGPSLTPHGAEPKALAGRHVPARQPYAGPTIDILIVEDNPANLMLAGAVLRRAGHRIVEARSAEEAIVRLRTTKPDLILVDIELPGEDGLALTRQLKAAPETAAVTVVALTAHAMASDRDRAFAAGCDGYITKPFDVLRLAQDVEALAGKC
jgi:two-component system cell cycle response regulator DivK